MKIEYLNEFIVLAEEKSFSRAAAKLFISQSALTKHIRELETHYGVTLFERTTHHVEITQAGKTACKAFKDIWNKYSALETKLADYSEAPSGTLTLGIMYYSLYKYASAFLPMFRRKYPRINLAIKTYQPHDMHQDILKGETDIGELPLGNYSGNGRLNCHRTFDTKFVIMVDSRRDLARFSSVTLDQIKDRTLILLEDDYIERISTEEALSRCGIEFSEMIFSDNVEGVVDTILNNDAIFLTGEDVQNQKAKGISYIPVSDSSFLAPNAFYYLKENENPLLPIFLSEVDMFFGYA